METITGLNVTAHGVRVDGLAMALDFSLIFTGSPATATQYLMPRALNVLPRCFSISLRTGGECTLIALALHGRNTRALIRRFQLILRELHHVSLVKIFHLNRSG